MSNMMNQFTPDYVVHPGVYLEEVLEAREIKKRDFAERIGLSVKAVSQIINQKSLFSPDVALQFEKTLDIAAEIWLGMMEAYQLHEARQKERDTLKNDETKEWLKQFPISEMKRMGILPDTRDSGTHAEAVLRFFSVSSPETYNDYQKSKVASFRKSAAFEESKGSTMVWLRLAEKEAEKIECDEYDSIRFKKQLERIREMTVLEPQDFCFKLKKICQECGVALVFVPEHKGTHLSGAAFKASAKKRVIAISLRYKTNDHFWFTFFHEAAHLILHGKKSVFLDLKEVGAGKEEDQANQFACDLLIPPQKYKEFISGKSFSENRICQFASGIGIHSGIVVGRLQHDKKIPFSAFYSIKSTYELVNKEKSQETFHAD